MPDRDPQESPREPATPDPPAEVRSRVDDMSEASFPASDPPAVWTWDVKREPQQEPGE
jgi:hypothetical protein